MAIKAVAFDLGGTLVNYPFPLNWQASFPAALTKVLEALGEPADPLRLQEGAAVLDQFNTRTHPREWEVRSDAVFQAIFAQWQIDIERVETAKEAFYGFFQAQAEPSPEAEDLLCALHELGIATGLLSDVAYGMDTRFALRDVAALAPRLDVMLTSVDVGWRKPHPAGFQRLLDALSVEPREMMYVGDEQKDIQGANRLGIVSVLLDRQKSGKQFGQRATLDSLEGVLGLIDEMR